ncbi:hypothetical protein [Phenylobacterium sp.]|uniref:hypothetical protein n=1 Tax=Phenylobacterium sp. TaxID=1871053 RepID=UPI002C475732|nr:hypothetical protein [Phenylobacterium sp.]HLZ76234.1 hypothetical protein [Phenylobacterium sp.]
MKVILAVMMAAFLSTSSSAAVKAPQAAGDRMIAAILDTALVAAQDGDAERVLISLQPAMQDEVFNQLSKPTQYEVAALYAAAARDRGRWDEAYPAFVRATQSEQASAEDWDSRLHGAIITGQSGDAFAVFQHLRTQGKPIFSTFFGARLLAFDALLGDLPNRDAARVALGREIEREGWQPVFATDDLSPIWLHEAEALQNIGDVAGARRAAAKITQPGVLVALLADRRFDAIMPAAAAARDPRAVAERQLDRVRSYVEANPRLLGARIAQIRALMILDRPADALAVADATLQSILRARRSEPPFDDMGNVEAFDAWRASALVGAGHLDQGVSSLTTAASCRCSVTASLQAGNALMRAGRAQEAKSWLDGIDEADFDRPQRMKLAQTRACVAAQLGDRAAAETQLAFLRAHEAWEPAVLVGALLCAGELQEADTVLARRIADPQSRLAALSAIQDLPADSGSLPYLATIEARWHALAAMPQVSAAVGKWGRINRFDLVPLDSIA